MRRPARAEFRERTWTRHALEAVGQAEAVADAEIVNRQDVGPAKAEHQQHLHGPAADSAHLRDALDDHLVFERVQFRRGGHYAAEYFVGEVAQRANLRKGKTDRAQRRVGGCRKLRRLREFRRRIQRRQPFDYAPGNDAVQLLVSDRAGERRERRLLELRLQCARPGRGDQPRHHRIECRQRAFAPAHGASV